MKMTNKKIVIQVFRDSLIIGFFKFYYFFNNRFRQTDHAC